MANHKILKINPILRFFEYKHLPEKLQAISKPFGELAKNIDQLEASSQEEKEMALRKLLEAKDCAVRAILPVKNEE
jgi:NAD(P)H-dependent FMN reductase